MARHGMAEDDIQRPTRKRTSILTLTFILLQYASYTIACYTVFASSVSTGDEIETDIENQVDTHYKVLVGSQLAVCIFSDFTQVDNISVCLNSAHSLTPSQENKDSRY